MHTETDTPLMPAAAAALPAATAQPAGAARPVSVSSHRIAFSGRGREYLNLWCANLLLTLLTLGLYIPFARRRKLQFFLGRTELADSPLEFTAPWQRMFKGFLFFAGPYLAYEIASYTGQETAATLFLVAFWLIFPWVWVSSLRFRLAHIRWRGVRLQFRASSSEVYRACLPWLLVPALIAGVVLVIGGFQLDLPIGSGMALTAAGLAVVLLGLVRLEYNQTRLLLARGGLGQLGTRWKHRYADFVRPSFVAAGVMVLGSAAMVVLVILGIAGMQLPTQPSDPAVVGLMMAVALVLVLVALPLWAWREARLFRLVWDHTGVEELVRFRCDLSPWGYVWLRVRNAFLTTITLGLFHPFAAVSQYRMKVESVTLHVKGDLDQVRGELLSQQAGLGDALADMVGFDLVT